MTKQLDGLSLVSSQPLIPPEKVEDKNLDQMTLPERSALLREAYHLIGDGEATEEELEVIGNLQASIQDKVASWGLLIKKVNNAADLCLLEAEYYKKKLEETKARAEVFQNKSKRMADYIRDKMIEFNLKKIETPLLSISLRKLPEKVEILEDADINSPEHPDFVQTTVSQRWDKGAIKAKLKEGQLFKTVKLSDLEFTLSLKGVA